jgi:hypothetical protein
VFSSNAARRLGRYNVKQAFGAAGISLPKSDIATRPRRFTLRGRRVFGRGLSTTLTPFCACGIAFDFKHAFVFQADDSAWILGGRDSDMTQSTIEFEEMATAMRERLRPTEARLLADWLRSYVGLSESRLLRKLLQELSSSDQRESESSRTRESWRAYDVDQPLNRKSA